MYNKTRICECCGKELVYGSYSAWYFAEKNHSICKSCAIKRKVKKLSDLSILLEDTPETYYWIGFLLADGHFDEKRIVVGLSGRDRDHLEKFAKYINYTGKIREVKRPPYDDAVTLSSMDTEVVRKLREKFDIKSNKTSNPPKTLKWIPESLLLCLFAGFIDGDGNISNFHNRKDCFIRIKLHSSWLGILNEFCPLFNERKTASINKKGYAELFLSGFEDVKKLKRIFLEKNLPIMSRKWDKIDLNLKTKYEIKKERDKKIEHLLNEHLKIKDIAKTLGVCESVVYKYIKEYGIKERSVHN